jgi:AcrR family transcriptional regulator
MESSASDPPLPTGLRERKRADRLQHITDVAIRLFIARGYQATTIDLIAAEAGISRRTFFSYFKSKDDILLSLQSGLGPTIAEALENEPSGKSPLQAVRDAIIRLCSRYPADEMIALDRLMRSSEAVQARKQAGYIEHERTIFAALRTRWPDPGRATALRLVAMIAIGAVRLALETLNLEEGRRPLADIMKEAFAVLETDILGAPAV